MHLLFECESVSEIIRICDNNGVWIKILFPRREWISASYGSVLYFSEDYFNNIKLNIKILLNNIDSFSNDNINDKFWKSYEGYDTGLVDLNWRQLNYAIWALDKIFGTPINSDNRYYTNNEWL